MLRAGILSVLVTLAACGGGSKTTTAPTTPAKAAKILVNVDDSGVGLGGNDPVAYSKANAAVAGDASMTSSFGGASYQFSSTDNKSAFDADPKRSAPQYGGYCAFAASQNRLSESDPAIFTIHDGQLLVFTNEDFREQFMKDPAGNKAKADQNWPGLVEQYGK
ncbi:MAG TPA: YHS domain-containing (seleno)protein [Kofleriaceae bacterium]|nr:YHS domain-containing (seleno)protein [Kofleriaceae bacterium]